MCSHLLVTGVTLLHDEHVEAITRNVPFSYVQRRTTREGTTTDRAL